MSARTYDEAFREMCAADLRDDRDAVRALLREMRAMVRTAPPGSDLAASAARVDRFMRDHGIDPEVAS